jgi:hypothetical protein
VAEHLTLEEAAAIDAKGYTRTALATDHWDSWFHATQILVEL